MFLILNAAVLIGCYLQLFGVKPSEGVFVGALLSMSSTAVVKCHMIHLHALSTLIDLYWYAVL